MKKRWPGSKKSVRTEIQPSLQCIDRARRPWTHQSVPSLLETRKPHLAVSSSGTETLDVLAGSKRDRFQQSGRRDVETEENEDFTEDRRPYGGGSDRDPLPTQWLYWELCVLKSWILFLSDVLQRVTFGIKIKSISRWYCSCFKHQDVQSHMCTIHLLTA